MDNIVYEFKNGTCDCLIKNRTLTITAGDLKESFFYILNESAGEMYPDTTYVEILEKIVIEPGVILPVDCSAMFQGFSYVKQFIGLEPLQTKHVKNMTNMFNFCMSVEKLEVENWDVSNVVSMAGMFGECEKLKTINLAKWNTAKVERMDSMFYYCPKLEHLDVSNFNTSNLEFASMMSIMVVVKLKKLK